ncbi:MAG: lipoate--protein ligase family protein [Acidimicrobiia bacterium]
MALLSHETWTPPALDTAISATLLTRADREGLATVRLFVPERAVVFGRQDSVRPGFSRAVVATRAAGFAPVLRLAGGRAAVFHEGTVAVSIAEPTAYPREEIRGRFVAVAGVIAAALRSLGADARVGEVPGEYCPGEYSVNLGGTRKVAGLGQRLRRGGAHVGGVVVVDDAETINAVLVPVYDALGYDWDPGATGALGSGVTPAVVIEAVVTALGEAGWRLTPGPIADEVIEDARTRLGDHELTDRVA